MFYSGLATDINGRTDLIKSKFFKFYSEHWQTMFEAKEFSNSLYLIKEFLELSKLGIVPPRVDYVVTTHGHADHAGNTNEFPDAVHFQGNLLHSRTRFNFSDLFDVSIFIISVSVSFIPSSNLLDYKILKFYGYLRITAKVDTQNFPFFVIYNLGLPDFPTRITAIFNLE